MAFSLPDRYTWDFWIVRDRSTYHLFFLNAPKSIAKPIDRHHNVRIDHATSADLVHWTYEGNVLSPSPEPAFDDGTTWTGCVVRRPDDQWMMFYTGTRLAEDFKVQRIGAAVSDDLFVWRKLTDTPLIEADPRYYDKLDLTKWQDEAWRDPWVFQCDGDPRWHMVMTARGREGPVGGRGAVGYAISDDLQSWRVAPPLYVSDRYGQMEVPQIFALDGRWYCLFCVSHREMDPSYLATGRSGHVIGTHYLLGDGPLGPWRAAEDVFLAGDPIGRLYAGRMVIAPDGRPVFLAFLHDDEHGRFVGALSDPMPLWTTAEGHLRVDARKYGIPLRDAMPAGTARYP